jgi:hypothetical protein
MMNLYYAFVVGIIFTLAIEFLLACFCSWWSNRELKRADVILKKYGSNPWSKAPGNPHVTKNLQKIEDFIKEKFPPAPIAPVLTMTIEPVVSSIPPATP